MQRYHRILVGVDVDYPRADEKTEGAPASHSEFAVENALQIARHVGAEVTFVHCFAVSDKVRKEFEAAAETAGSPIQLVEQAGRELVKRAEDAGVRADFQAPFGRPAQTLAGMVGDGGYDLVVVGSRQRSGLRTALFGSTANQAMASCACDVFIALRPASHAYKRIEIALALSEECADVLRSGLALPRASDGEIEVIHGVENWFQDRWYRAGYARAAIEREHEEEKQQAKVKLEELVGRVAAEEHLPAPPVRVVTGDREDIVWEAVTSTEVDVVVVGMAGRTGFHRFWMGNTAEVVVPELPCSLLAVKRR